MGTFFKMVVQYKNKIGFTGQLLIEPKPKEPMKHQYDYGELRVTRNNTATPKQLVMDQLAKCVVVSSFLRECVNAQIY